jgi:hypothetical protein
MSEEKESRIEPADLVYAFIDVFGSKRTMVWSAGTLWEMRGPGLPLSPVDRNCYEAGTIPSVTDFNGVMYWVTPNIQPRWCDGRRTGVMPAGNTSDYSAAASAVPGDLRGIVQESLRPGRLNDPDDSFLVATPEKQALERLFQCECCHECKKPIRPQEPCRTEYVQESPPRGPTNFVDLDKRIDNHFGPPATIMFKHYCGDCKAKWPQHGQKAPITYQEPPPPPQEYR